MNQSQALASIKSIVRKYLPDPSYTLLLFGSRAAGYGKPYSDFDIGIVGPEPIPWRTVARINEDLEESSLPYVVDVVDLTAVDDSFRILATKYAHPI